MNESIREGEPLLVVSPHLDDAVFSCGRLLTACRGSTVVTVLAGTPRDARMSTDWDRRCGFDDAAQAMWVRRDEDRAALRRVGAEATWLDFCDGQYAEPVAPDRVAALLAEILLRHADRPLLVPLGLFHSDHLLTHAAAAQAIVVARRRGRASVVLAYEDAPYRSMDGVLQQRLAALAADGVCATPVAAPAADDAAPKRRAVETYASQVPLFGPHGLDDLWRPERLWRLAGGLFSDAETSN